MVGYVRYLQDGKRLKTVFGNNDKIYTRSLYKNPLWNSYIFNFYCINADLNMFLDLNSIEKVVIVIVI